jgi:glucose-6-phosphate 1-dehydrogenase
LPENFILVGFSRKDLSNEEFKKSVKEIIDKNFSLEKRTEDKLNLFLNRIVYIQGDFNHKKRL